jgi:hypothetical protein
MSEQAKNQKTFNLLERSEEICKEIAGALIRYYDGFSPYENDTYPPIGFDTTCGLDSRLRNLEVYKNEDDEFVVKIYTLYPGLIIGKAGRDITGFSQYLKYCLKTERVAIRIVEAFTTSEIIIRGKPLPYKNNNGIVLGDEEFDMMISIHGDSWKAFTKDGGELVYLKELIDSRFKN